MAVERSALTKGFYFVASLLAAACLSGCSGGSDVDTIDVSGTLTRNGEPVANVAITFNPDADGLIATGKTDAEGKFAALTTRESDDGIAEGSYTVTLSKVTEASVDVGDNVGAYAQTATSELPFPTKYLNTAESDLKVTISAGGETELTLALTD